MIVMIIKLVNTRRHDFTKHNCWFSLGITSPLILSLRCQAITCQRENTNGAKTDTAWTDYSKYVDDPRRPKMVRNSIHVSFTTSKRFDVETTLIDWRFNFFWNGTSINERFFHVESTLILWLQRCFGVVIQRLSHDVDSTLIQRDATWRNVTLIKRL